MNINDYEFPYRIDVYLTASSEAPEHHFTTSELTHDDACRQADIVLNRFMAHRVVIFPIVVAGRWLPLTPGEISALSSNLRRCFVRG